MKKNEFLRISLFALGLASIYPCLASANEYGRIVDQCDEEERAARRRGDYSFDRNACANCRERERTYGFRDGVPSDSACARFVSPSLLRRDSSGSNSSSGSSSSFSSSPRGGLSSGEGQEVPDADRCLIKEVRGEVVWYRNQCREPDIRVTGVCASIGLEPLVEPDSTLVLGGTSSDKICRRSR